MMFAGALAALVTVIAIGIVVSDRCSGVTGIPDCFSGVVNSVTPAFSSTADQIFPFAAMHDRVDVVIKSVYWNELRTYSKFVKCVGPDQSPVLMAFFHNDQVCNAGAGAVTGAVVGGVVGAILGAAAATSAIGCATVILCIFALIIAAIIAIVGAIVGAVVGGQIGKAATGSTAPSGIGAGGSPKAIQVGDYVTIQGNLVVASFLDGEAVLWWVYTDPSDPRRPSLHGTSSGKPDFSYKDPDANIGMDGCSIIPTIM